MKAYFLKYNNMYDREEKKLDTIEEYQEYLAGDVIDGIINFTEGDGVQTTLIVNTYKDKNWIGNPDYLVMTDDTYDTILHRWFVTEFEKLRNGQYRATLFRDVVVDNYDAVMNSPCFIEKATIPDDNDLIFNSEGNTYNQIKKDEILLKDESQSAWIVGYLSRNFDTKSGSIQIGNNYDVSLTTYTHSTWPLATYNTSSSAVRANPSTLKLSLYFKGLKQINEDVTRTVQGIVNVFKNGPSSQETFDTFGSTKTGFDVGTESNLNAVMDYDWNELFDMSNIESGLAVSFDYASSNQANDIVKYNNKKIQFSDGVYLCKVIATNYSQEKNLSNSDGAVYISDLYPVIKDKVEEIIGRQVYGEESPIVKAKVEGTAYYVRLEKVVDNQQSIQWTIPSGRNHLTDAPYDMFCIPLNSVIFGTIPGGDSYTQIDGIGNIVTSDIINQLETGSGGSELYDIQIVPYCPFTKAIQSYNTISVLTLEEHTDYEYITDSNDDPIGLMLFPTSSSFSVVIPQQLVVENVKVSSETEFVRLCSPNYTGVFEFNVAKNGGVKFFEANCTYLPFNPYIQVNPNFGRLYGKDFNDNRGLICGGEFSMAVINDQWKTYQLNNKNYEKSFQRNITSLEFQNKYAEIRDVAGAIRGAVGAGTTGAALGGPSGALGMGTVSAVAGVADVFMNKQLRQENLNLQKDQFNYSLQNIQALPFTLSRTTSYTINNKFFPFIELYGCTDVERESLILKLKYEGMTVMTIGKLIDYLQSDTTFIKGRMIKVQGESYYEDTHMSRAIRDRIEQGIYI